MIITPGTDDAPSEKRGKTFTGDVWLDPVLSADDGVRIATVFFTPYARTFWHRHEHGQILQVVAGSGFVCTRGEQPQPLRAGDTVWVPPREEHWHGAAPDSFMSHTAISLGTTEWADEVTGAEYAAVASH